MSYHAPCTAELTSRAHSKETGAPGNLQAGASCLLRTLATCAGTVLLPHLQHLAAVCISRLAWPGSLLCPPSLAGPLVRLRLAPNQALPGCAGQSVEVQLMQGAFNSSTLVSR